MLPRGLARPSLRGTEGEGVSLKPGSPRLPAGVCLPGGNGQWLGSGFSPREENSAGVSPQSFRACRCLSCRLIEPLCTPLALPRARAGGCRVPGDTPRPHRPIPGHSPLQRAASQPLRPALALPLPSCRGRAKATGCLAHNEPSLPVFNPNCLLGRGESFAQKNHPSKCPYYHLLKEGFSVNISSAALPFPSFFVMCLVFAGPGLYPFLLFCLVTALSSVCGS